MARVLSATPDPARGDIRPGSRVGKVFEIGSGPARRAILQVFDGWLRRREVTPFELLHRLDLFDAALASGPEMEGAIYAAALGLAARDARPLPDVAADLEAAIRDGRDAAAAAALTPQLAARRALALRMGACDGWRAKLDLVVSLGEAAGSGSEADAAALAAIEPALTDLIAGPWVLEALASLDGPGLGARIEVLTAFASPAALAALTLCPDGSGALGADLARRTARLVHAGRVFEPTRRAAARRVLAAAASGVSLTGGPVTAEFDALLALTRLIAAAREAFDRDEAVRCLARRWRAACVPDALDRLARAAADALSGAERLVGLAEQAVGFAPCEALAAAAVRALTAPAGDPTVDPVRLAALRRRAGRLGVSEPCRAALLSAIDALAPRPGVPKAA